MTSLGYPSFIASFVDQKVSLWKQELTLLSEISVTQPYAAYTCFIVLLVSEITWLDVFIIS